MPVQLRRCRHCGDWVAQHERGWWYDPVRVAQNPGTAGLALCKPGTSNEEHQPVDEIPLPDVRDFEAVGAWLDA